MTDDVDLVLLLLLAVLGGVSVLLVIVTALESWMARPPRGRG